MNDNNLLLKTSPERTDKSHLVGGETSVPDRNFTTRYVENLAAHAIACQSLGTIIYVVSLQYLLL